MKFFILSEFFKTLVIRNIVNLINNGVIFTVIVTRERDGTVNVFHYSFQNVSTFRLERFQAFLIVQRYSRSLFLTMCVFDRLRPFYDHKSSEGS